MFFYTESSFIAVFSIPNISASPLTPGTCCIIFNHEKWNSNDTGTKKENKKYKNNQILKICMEIWTWLMSMFETTNYILFF